MLGIQFMESAIYAIYHALAVVLIESIAAYSLTGVWINWNEIGSLFYSQTGAVADAGFLGVAITVGMLYFLKYMIVFGFLDLLFWNPRYMFTVWILLIVLAGTLITYFVKKTVFESLLSTVLGKLELTEVFSNIADNHLLDVSGIILYLSLVVLFFFLTMQMIQKRRWS